MSLDADCSFPFQSSSAVRSTTRRAS